MPRLLVFFPSVERGGCEEYALSMGRAAQEAGFCVEACFPRVPGTRSLEDDFRASGVKCRRWRVGESAAPGTWGDREEQRREALEHLTRARPDAALLALPWPDSALGFIEACGERGVAGAVTFQLCTEIVPIDPDSREACARARRGGLRWIAVSKSNRRYLAESLGAPEDAIDLVYNGAADPPDPGCRAAARAELGLPPDARLLITIGRLCEQKGYPQLVEVLPALCDESPTIHCLWVGDGELGAELRQAVRAAGLGSRVHFTGYRRDALRLLVSADLFVLPSLVEGSPFAVVEAMACGCPIVTSDAGGNAELIEPGVHGLIHAAGDREGLAAALRRALGDPGAMAQMAAAARERSAEFRAERMHARTLAILRAGL